MVASRKPPPEITYSAVISAIESLDAEITRTVELHMSAGGAITKEGFQFMQDGTPEKATERDQQMIKVYRETDIWIKEMNDKRDALYQKKFKLEAQMGL